MRADVVIVGAGLVGGSLAVALARGGVSVVLVDARGGGASAAATDPHRYDLRVYALRPGSRRFLERSDIWRDVDAGRVAAVHKMIVTGDDENSRLTFDAYRSHLSELAVIAEESNLRTAVSAALGRCDLVTQVIGARCTALHRDESSAIVHLDNGETVEARLVVAADGAHSSVRGLAGVTVNESEYGHSGVVANFDCSRPHEGTAWQWFRSDGVLALLPLPGDRVSMVWSTQQAHADELTGLGTDTLAARVGEASHLVLGELRQAGDIAAFPLRLMRASDITAARLALVGDAAHNVHPLAGQGLNLGLADAESLSSAIVGRGPDDPGSRAVLARYRRSRAEEIAAMQLTTDGLHRLFQSTAPGIAWMRNAGLRLTEQLTPLKRLLVKHAAG